jgi:L-histidine N-alpha-methyltransferase
MGAGDRFLLGADLKKDPRVLEAAYNDTRGVTASFNLNILGVLNRELGADFDAGAFEHRAFYDAAKGRIEMHLVARSKQVVHIPRAGRYEIEGGESIRTEISCKYDRPTVERLFRDAGLALEQWVTDADGRYALATARSAT